MSAAPVGAACAWAAILAMATHVFTRPGYDLFRELADSWVLTPGRRTITRMIAATGTGRRAHDAYHRFVRDGAWHPDELWRVLAVAVVERLVADAEVHLDVDDTLLHRPGRHVADAGAFRDAVRSTRNRLVRAFGLNLVVVTVRIAPPWGGMPIGLPIHARVRRKPNPDTPTGPDASVAALARDMLTQIAGWLPHHHFHVAGDAGYASLVGANIPRTTITTRLRRDAALYDLPPPPTGRPGRPRKKGDRLPPLADLAATADWTPVTYDQRGTPVTRLIWSRKAIWYRAAGNTPLRLVIVRDPEGRQPDDYLITTDLDAPPDHIAARYTGRWTIEVTFRDAKQHLAAHGPQTWKRHGPRRAAYLPLWLHAAVWLWYLQVWGARRSWTPTPWYPNKTTPSFADALAALRRTLWTQRITSLWPTPNPPTKILQPLIDTLARAA